MTIAEADPIDRTGQIIVGAQGHAGIGHAVVEMDFQAQGSRRHGEVIEFEVTPFNHVVGGEVRHAGRVNRSKLVRSHRAKAVKGVAGTVRSFIAIGRVRVHAFADHGDIVGAIGDGGFHGIAARQLGKDVVAILLLFAPAANLRCRGASAGHVGQVILLNEHHGFAVRRHEPKFPTGLPRRHLHLVIDRLARRDVGAADGADEGHVEDWNALIGADAATNQGITRAANTGRRGRIDACIVTTGFQRIAPAHRENGAVTVRAIRVVVIARPVVSRRPLIAAGPGGESPGIIPIISLVVSGIESFRREVAADDQLRRANSVGEAEIPAKGVAWHIVLEIAPDVVGLE